MSKKATSKRGRGAYVCEICNSSFRSGDNLHKHLKTAKCMRGRLLQNFIGQQEGVEYENNNIQSATYICGNCNKTFNSGPDFELHLSSRECIEQVKEEQFTCGFCGISFKAADDVEKHIGARHAPIVAQTLGNQPSNSTFTCGRCQSGFDTDTSLQRHVYSNTCKAVSSYTCGICQALFQDSETLSNHMQVHITNSSDTVLLNPETGKFINHVQTNPFSAGENNTPLYKCYPEKTDTVISESSNHNGEKAANALTDKTCVQEETDTVEVTSSMVSCSKRKRPKGNQKDKKGKRRKMTDTSTTSCPTSIQTMSDSSSNSSSVSLINSTEVPLELPHGRSIPYDIDPKAQKVMPVTADSSLKPTQSISDISNLGLAAVCPSCNKPGTITESGYVCDRCKLIFSNFKCEHCSKIFPEISSLMKHLRNCCKKNVDDHGSAERSKPREEVESIPAAVKIEPADTDTNEASNQESVGLPAIDNSHQSVADTLNIHTDFSSNDSTECIIHEQSEGEGICEKTDQSSEVDKKPSDKQMRDCMGKFREFIKKRANELKLTLKPNQNKTGESGTDLESEKQPDGINIKDEYASSLDVGTLTSSSREHKISEIKKTDVPNIIDYKPVGENISRYSDPESVLDKTKCNPINPNRQFLHPGISVYISESESEISDSSGFEEIKLDEDDFEEITSVASNIKEITTFPQTNIESIKTGKAMFVTDTKASAKDIENSISIKDDRTGKGIVSDTKVNPIEKHIKKRVLTKRQTQAYKTGVFVMDSDEDSSDSDFDVAKKKNKRRDLPYQRKTRSKILTTARKQQLTEARERRGRLNQMQTVNSSKLNPEISTDLNEMDVTEQHTSGPEHTVVSDSGSSISHSEQFSKAMNNETNNNSDIDASLSEVSQCASANRGSNTKQKEKCKKDSKKKKKSEHPQSDKEEEFDKESEAEDYICGECKQYFVSLSSLRKHLKTHSEQLDEPDVTETASEAVTGHPSVKTTDVKDKDQFVCGICQLQTNTAEKLAEHMQTHASSNKFVCNVCEQICPSLTALQQHLKVHNLQTEEFVCGLCCSSFSSVESLEAHIGTHSKRASNGQVLTQEVKSITRSSAEKSASSTEKTVEISVETSPLVRKSAADSTQKKKMNSPKKKKNDLPKEKKKDSNEKKNESQNEKKNVLRKKNDPQEKKINSPKEQKNVLQKTNDSQEKKRDSQKEMKNDTQKGKASAVVSQLLRYKPPLALFDSK